MDTEGWSGLNDSRMKENKLLYIWNTMYLYKVINAFLTEKIKVNLQIVFASKKKS